MPNANKVILIGNLTRDWEVRQHGETTVGKCGIAVNRKFKDKEETTFVDLTAFGRSAENLAKYTGKGRPIYVEGRLHLSQWESQSGEKRSKLEVIIEQFQFLGGRDEVSSSSDPKTKFTDRDDDSIDPDDIPF